MPPHASRSVFVANIPFDVSEEQIAGVFSEVGPVSNVEIKFDPQTGRSKGFAFVQFHDEATAQSAVRNLQDVPINGRPVRIEFAEDQRRPGGPPGRGGGGPGYGRASPANFDDFNIPGQEPPPGQKATDAISKTLAAINPGQMQDVMANMKHMITADPEQARKLLTSQPQMAYALFQAMLLMNIVDASVLQRIQPLPSANPGGPGPAAYPPPPAAFPPYPPSGAPAYPAYPPPGAPAPPFRQPPPPSSYRTPPQGGRTPQPYGGYQAPPAPAAAPAAPAPPALTPGLQNALAGLAEDQRAMVLQVLQLTPDQISGLDPAQQASIQELRQQFLGI